MSDRMDHSRRPIVEPTEHREAVRAAVSRLITNTHTPILATSFRIDLLCEAFVSPDVSRYQTAVKGLFQSDLTPQDILTRLIPETARRMGDHWQTNKLSFAEVTIGTARLQQVLHTRTRDLEYPETNGAARILLVVPQPEQHTLGAHVAAHIWRNHSVHVEMALGESPANIALRVKNKHFSAVCVSVSARRNLAWAQAVVESIRKVAHGNTKVFVGGGVTALGSDIKALTGCDVVCKDPMEVLAACGLDQKQDQL